MSNTRTPARILGLLILTFAATPALAAAQSDRPAAADAVVVDLEAAPALSAAGYIYGRVHTTRGKTYEGRLVWNRDEETFWDDAFNGSKEDLPYVDQIPETERRKSVEVFGVKIGWRSSDWSHGRSIAARFGDIRKIEVRHRDEAVLFMKDDTEYELDGGANDLGAKILVDDRTNGEVELDWRDIQDVELLPAPAGLPVENRRLYGTVTTSGGKLRGFVQWDKDERFAHETLDGEDEDDYDHKIPFGKIRRIERKGSSRSVVTFVDGHQVDGHQVELSGTNDVNDENRGIVVNDPRYGRVVVNWEAFTSVDFEEVPSSGPAYEEFEPGGPLQGEVRLRGGRTLRGEIVYDVDESRTWEILDGETEVGEYEIPFALVRSIAPDGDDGAHVVLRNGEELRLGGTADVDTDNAGIVVVDGGGKATYAAWSEVEKITFDDASER